MVHDLARNSASALAAAAAAAAIEREAAMWCFSHSAQRAISTRIPRILSTLSLYLPTYIYIFVYYCISPRRAYKRAMKNALSRRGFFFSPTIRREKSCGIQPVHCSISFLFFFCISRSQEMRFFLLWECGRIVPGSNRCGVRCRQEYNNFRREISDATRVGRGYVCSCDWCIFLNEKRHGFISITAYVNKVF